MPTDMDGVIPQERARLLRGFGLPGAHRNQQPDHGRISDFLCRNLDGLKGLCVQILRLCHKAGMVSLGHTALDVTQD